MTAPKKETPAERTARHVREMRDYERAHDLVPGTARHGGDGPGGGPTGGMEREGLARMALAKPASARTEAEWEAMADHPDPRSGVTGLPGWETRGHPGS